VLDYVSTYGHRCTTQPSGAHVELVGHPERDAQGETLFCRALAGEIRGRGTVETTFCVKFFLRPPCHVALKVSSCLGTSKPMRQLVPCRVPPPYVFGVLSE
jgi:hypothetical protein